MYIIYMFTNEEYNEINTFQKLKERFIELSNQSNKTIVQIDHEEHIKTIFGVNSCKLNNNIIEIINELLIIMSNINEPADVNDFTSLLIELSLFLYLLNDQNPNYVIIIINKLKHMKVQPFDDNNIIEKIIYSNMSISNKKTIDNIDEIYISQDSKNKTFKEVDEYIKNNGFISKSDKVLLWNIKKSIFILIPKVKLLLYNYEDFPKSLTKIMDNYFICLPASNLESQEQDIRQILRIIFNREFQINITAEFSIFYIIDIIKKLLLHNIDNDLIILLQKYARIQCGKSIIINKNEHSKKNLINFWIEGLNPKIYTNASETHMDLYNCINSFNLEKIFWWAIVCSILGNDVFNGQKHHFNSYSFGNSSELILEYFISKYSKNKLGNPAFINLYNRYIISVLSLEYYNDEEIDNLVKMKDHYSPNEQLCNIQTIYSKKEAFTLEKCIWCNQTDICFDEYRIELNNFQIKNIIDTAERID